MPKNRPMPTATPKASTTESLRTTGVTLPNTLGTCLLPTTPASTPRAPPIPDRSIDSTRNWPRMSRRRAADAVAVEEDRGDLLGGLGDGVLARGLDADLAHRPPAEHVALHRGDG